ncbi:MAG: helix-turn-helix domain-containing protein [Bacteroidota bacterium]
MNLGEQIAHLRKAKGISQDELADLIGVSRGAISMYEINKREPDYETLQKLADFFGVSTDYLLGRTNKATRKDAARFVPVAPKTRKLYDVISRAEDLPEENVEQIADAVEALINHHKAKQARREGHKDNDR